MYRGHLATLSVGPRLNAPTRTRARTHTDVILAHATRAHTRAQWRFLSQVFVSRLAALAAAGPRRGRSHPKVAPCECGPKQSEAGSSCACHSLTSRSQAQVHPAAGRPDRCLLALHAEPQRAKAAAVKATRGVTFQQAASTCYTHTAAGYSVRGPRPWPPSADGVNQKLTYVLTYLHK